MGQIADDIMMGFICQHCLLPVDGGAPGHPRSCDECKEEHNEHSN
jgi:hypothetical protein